MLTPEALDDLNARGDRLRDRLNAAIREVGVPAVATGRGSLVVLHFAEGPVSAPHELPPVPAGLRALVHLGMIERGHYFARRGFCALSLPITDADVDGFVAAMAETLSSNAPLIRETVAAAS